MSFSKHVKFPLPQRRNVNSNELDGNFLHTFSFKLFAPTGQQSALMCLTREKRKKMETICI